MYGTSFAPIYVVRQLRELTVDGAREYDLTDSDRLNGFEWAGEVRFKESPCREAGEPGIMLDGLPEGRNIMRQRGRWTQWVEFKPEAVRIQKVKGKWQIHEDTWLLEGRFPDHKICKRGSEVDLLDSSNKWGQSPISRSGFVEGRIGRAPVFSLSGRGAVDPTAAIIFKATAA